MKYVPEMKWNAEADDLYQRIVERVPEVHRGHVAPALRRGAVESAARAAAPAVTPKELIVGFFEVTPEAFHGEVRANLGSLGIDYTQFLSPSPAHAEDRLDLHGLVADLKAMSALAEVPFDEQKTRAVIDAYAESFRTSPVAMRTTTKPVDRRDLSVRYLDMLGRHDLDPLAVAYAKHFVENDGHPVFALYQEVKERCGAFGFGVDLNVRSGFSKIWMAPSLKESNLATISTLCHLPQGVRKAAGHLERFGFGTCGLWGFDFVHKTVNLYFMINQQGSSARDYGALLADLGFHSDLPGVLDACRPAHVVYYSFSWESERVERVCFAVVCEHRAQVPLHFHPLIVKCLGDAVFMHGREKCIYSVVWSPRGHYFKIDNDYSGTQGTQLVDAGRAGV